jgi:hypothetical protein
MPSNNQEVAAAAVGAELVAAKPARAPHNKLAVAAMRIRLRQNMPCFLVLRCLEWAAV